MDVLWKMLFINNISHANCIKSIEIKILIIKLFKKLKKKKIYAWTVATIEQRWLAKFLEIYLPMSVLLYGFRVTKNNNTKK